MNVRLPNGLVRLSFKNTTGRFRLWLDGPDGPECVLDSGTRPSADFDLWDWRTRYADGDTAVARLTAPTSGGEFQRRMLSRGV